MAEQNAKITEEQLNEIRETQRKSKSNIKPNWFC